MSKDMKPTRRAMLASAAATPLATTTPEVAKTAFVSRLSGLNQLVSRATAQATVIGSSVTAIQTQGYATPVDGGGAIYTKTGGSTPGGFQSADGAWWAIAISGPVPVKAFGVLGDGVTDDAAAINVALTYAATLGGGSLGGRVTMPAGTFRVGSTLVVPNWVSLVGQGKRATQISALNNFTQNWTCPDFVER
jgi:polygalacturonase